MPKHLSDGSPPDVPEQFRDAYQRAYEQALSEPAPTEVAPESVPLHDTPRHVFETEYRTRPAWLVPAAIAGGALALILSAYVLGRMVSGGSGVDSKTEPAAASPSVSDAAPSASPTPLATPAASPPAAPHKGKVKAVAVGGAQAGCTSKPGVDSAGKPVRYGAGNVIDGDPATAWRCDGLATGQRLVFDLPAGTEVAEVGLIPGYAKTDAKSGVDRYAENNRITEVTWILADGIEVKQMFAPDPKDRSMRTIRVPATAGEQLTLQIDRVFKAKRNTTMISEVWVAAPA